MRITQIIQALRKSIRLLFTRKYWIGIDDKGHMLIVYARLDPSRYAMFPTLDFLLGGPFLTHDEVLEDFKYWKLVLHYVSLRELDVSSYRVTEDYHDHQRIEGNDQGHG